MMIAFDARARNLAGAANNPIAEQLTMDSFSRPPNAVQIPRMKLGLSPANVSCLVPSASHQARLVSIDADGPWLAWPKTAAIGLSDARLAAARSGSRSQPAASGGLDANTFNPPTHVRRNRGVETARPSPD